MATAIRAYQLHNNGVAIDIWPQLRDVSDPDNTILWDPRKDNPNDTTLLHITQTGTYDLSMAGGRLDGKTFVLAANVRWGQDKFDIERHAFTYDPNSNVVACGEADGGADDGNVVWTGNKTE